MGRTWSCWGESSQAPGSSEGWNSSKDGRVGIVYLERRIFGVNSLSPSNTCRVTDGEGLFPKAWRDRTRGNGFKVSDSGFRWDIGEKFLPVRG